MTTIFRQVPGCTVYIDAPRRFGWRQIYAIDEKGLTNPLGYEAAGVFIPEQVGAYPSDVLTPSILRAVADLVEEAAVEKHPGGTR